MRVFDLLRRRDFALLWLGQLISVVGSGLSNFALGIWVFQTTQSATRFALIFLFAAIPSILTSLFAGALVDRWDRRRTMIACDVAGTLLTAAVALLAWTGTLAIWHVYVASAAIAFVAAFQLPAYAASLPCLVPKEDLARANGLVQMSRAMAQVFAPILAGGLVSAFAIHGVLAIDALSFGVAVVAMVLVRIPRPAGAAVAATASVLAEAWEGWLYVQRRVGLLAVLLLFAIFNLLLGTISVLITPMILAFASPAQLGIQMSVGGCGLLAGGLAMGVWGGPRRRIHGVVGFLVLAGIFLFLHGLRPSIPLLAAVGFAFFFTLPVINASNDAIWQVKVPLAFQGRSFAIQRVASEAATPLGYVMAGPLAERVFEPLLAPQGPLAGTLGALIGVGPGRGIALMFMVAGLLIAAVSAGAYLYRPLRCLEAELPDALNDDLDASDSPAPAFGAAARAAQELV